MELYERMILISNKHIKQNVLDLLRCEYMKDIWHMSTSSDIYTIHSSREEHVS